jgi:hypothetical protein
MSAKSASKSRSSASSAVRTRRAAVKSAVAREVAKNAPKRRQTVGAKSPAKVPTADRASSSEARGPSAATMAFAKKVVALRDKSGLPWAEVAAKLGVPYDHNGSSRLRRAYALGGGATVGARAANAAKRAAEAKKASPAKKAPAKTAPKTTTRRAPKVAAK